MADKQSRTYRNVQEVSHMEQAVSSKRQAMAHRNTDAVVDGKREVRRSKPELVLYRPGMGLRQKIQPAEKQDSPPKPGSPDVGPPCSTAVEDKCSNELPHSAFRDLSLKQGGNKFGNRMKRPERAMYVPKHVRNPPNRVTTPSEMKNDVPSSKLQAPSLVKTMPDTFYRDSGGTTDRQATVFSTSRKVQQNNPRAVAIASGGGSEWRTESSRSGESDRTMPRQTVLPIEARGTSGDHIVPGTGGKRADATDTADSAVSMQPRERRGKHEQPKRVGRPPVDPTYQGVTIEFGRTRENGASKGNRSGTEGHEQQEAPVVKESRSGTPISSASRHRSSGSQDGSSVNNDAQHATNNKKNVRKKGKQKGEDDRPHCQPSASNSMPTSSLPAQSGAPPQSGQTPQMSQPALLNGMTLANHNVFPEEEDWDGDLMVVEPSGRTYSQEDLTQNGNISKNKICSNVSPDTSRRMGLNRSRDSFSEEEEREARTPPYHNGPIIKDWSMAVVEEEERRQSALHEGGTLNRSLKEYSNRCSSQQEAIWRKNKRNEASRSSPPKATETPIPPRFQAKRSPPAETATRGGLLRIPRDMALTTKGAPDACDEREVFPHSTPDKPLIAVKPQPHIPMEMGGCSRALPVTPPMGFPASYEASPLVLVPAFQGILPAGFPCHMPGAHGVGPSHPVHHGDQILSPDAYGRSRIKPLVEKNLHDAALLERELMTYLSKGIQNIDIKAMGHTRWRLQLRYENVILADPRYCAEKNVEHALWKSAFYQGIETFRRVMEECPDFQEQAKMHLLNLVDEGTIFYENLLDKFQETYGFTLSHFLEPDVSGSCTGIGGGLSAGGGGVTPGRGLPDSVRLVLISAQKIYICLGDLARYREQAMGTTNYGRARSWYMKAQQIAPKNGRPYNQLAILALYARRKLDAVYHYMRSLAASNPFLTARESLLALFDDARKKYEHLERKRREEEVGGEQGGLWQFSERDQQRREVWIRPDGSTSHRSSRSSDLASKELDALARLSTIELNKRFGLSFLHVHGKLFTKVGMETFSETARRMLLELRVLLQRTPAAMSSVRHLQLLSINMFTVANTSLKDHSMDPQCRSLLQEQSLQVALAHVAILLERATTLVLQGLQSPLPHNCSSSSSSSSSLSSSSVSPPTSPPAAPSQLSDDLAELLPCLKVWTDWMSCQKRLWSPPPSPCDYDTSVKGNVWTTLADLLTVLRKLNLSDIKFFKEPAEDRELVMLPEDASLAGFVPLLGAPQESFYVQVPCDRERARNQLRISRIQFFGDYLCGIATPYLEFNVERKRFVSLITVCDTESDSEQEITDDSSDEELEMGDSLDDQETSLKSGEEENEIQKLWSKKEQLRRVKEQRERQQACVQAVLQEHRSKQAAMLEIRPRHVIPDTNCFIDHLPLLQRLVADGHFFVYVPLVVINELDGLARGTRQGSHQSAEHSQKVAVTARAALSYLEGRFAHREPKLKAITSKGSTLDTISFRSEDVRDNKGTNDDLILSCCLRLCKDHTEHLLPREPDAPVKLYRETVLITEDRNLCVKALTHHVPVRDLPAFLRWANIS